MIHLRRVKNILVKNLILLLAFISLSATKAGERSLVLGSFQASQSSKPKVSDFESNAWVDSVYNQMTLDEKIGQLFMIPVGTINDEKAEALHLIKNYHVGGVIFMKGHPTRQALNTNEFQAAAKIPLMIAIDGEWGLSMRLDSCMQYPKQMTLGAIQNNDLINQMGQQIGAECRVIGVNVDFAPVVDVNNNPKNPVINYRSFGEDKYNVALKGLAYAGGLQAANVIACAKHFPGHGNTDKDSHLTLPIVNGTYAELKETELFPFQLMAAQNVASFMVAHLNVPGLDNTPGMASSLSKKITTNLLRDTLGFKGLVFSDALNMKGVSNDYSSGQLELKALQAGNDVLLYSLNIPLGISTIKKAIEDKKYDENELSIHVKRILKAKYEFGISRIDTINISAVHEKLNSEETKTLIQNLYAEAITLAQDKQSKIPYKSLRVKKVAVVCLNASGDNLFYDYVSNYQQADIFELPLEFSSSSKDALLNKLNAYDEVIVSVHNMSWYNSKKYGISGSERSFINELNSKKSICLVLFGSPYSLSYFNDISAIMVANEDNAFTQKAAVEALFGVHEISGKTPVSAGEHFPVGTGIYRTGLGKMGWTEPADLKIDEQILFRINDIVNEAMKAKATPGCEVLVAKNNQVFYHQAFGGQTYNGKAVNMNDLYDLASITKVAATNLCVMKMYDEGALDLNATIGDYLTLENDSKIKDLTIKKVLLHEAGLKSWIPFYLTTIKNDSVYHSYYCNDSIKGYCIPVASGMYVKNEQPQLIWQEINETELNQPNKYVYSDLGFYIMQMIVENHYKKPLNDVVDSLFYKPMGLSRIGFLPLQHFPLSQIVPTEDDKVFRKQLVHGYVHDPGAALMGGVGGHAGLFSNAFDLAQIFQMLLNGGSYNGQSFFKPETVKLFTSYESGTSRRGLGFDKPEKDASKEGPTAAGIPLSTFGHTGFTGTCVWADPENQLVYVFLSNRVYPSAENKLLISLNTRTRIQSAIYEAIYSIPKP